MNKKEVRVRFAPSPTGELHIGGLRTALSCFLFSKKKGGKFILRIEDTDQKRLAEGTTRRIVESLTWAGLLVDEGVMLSEKGTVIQKGECGPYVQSERLAIYRKYVEQLLNEGKAYYCFCSPKRLESMRAEQMKNKQAPKYDRRCCGLSEKEAKEKIKQGEAHVVRFKIPKGKTFFKDLIFGKVEVENANIDDQIILKGDKFPTYHLAVVVDDYLMKISHVFRGAEWLPSTPKHILLYQAFGWEKETPAFVHLPNILNKERKKLSKREGSVSVQNFRSQGYPAEAIVNFISLLGWNPKTEQEIFSMEELIEQFDITKMSRAGGVFDMDKLNWISAQHIKKMDSEYLYQQAVPFLEKKEYFQMACDEKKTKEYVQKILRVEQERLEKFSEVGEENQFFFTDNIEISADSMRWRDSVNEDTKKNLQKALNALELIPDEDWELDNIEKILLDVAGEKRGDLLFPLRAALTGQERSPSPFEVAWVLGKAVALSRIRIAIKSI